MRKYIEGMNMNNFKRIDEISVYNYNYYIGINNDLILGVSDDDDTTEWYLSQYERFDKIGNSYYSQGNLLELK